jgi:hypothetical protein
MKICKQTTTIKADCTELKKSFEKFDFDDYEDIPCSINCDVIPGYLISEVLSTFKEIQQLDPEDGKIFD